MSHPVIGTPWEAPRRRRPRAGARGRRAFTGAAPTTSPSAKSTCAPTRSCAPTTPTPRRGEPRDFGRVDVKHRLVGHWGHHPGHQLPFCPRQPPHCRSRSEHDLPYGAPVTAVPPHRAEPARRYLPRDSPRHHQRRGRLGEVLPSVLVPRRHPQPLCARDPRLHPRGRRARLHALPRVRPRCSTTRACSPLPWWATARPRPARSPQAGSPTSS